MRRKQAGIQVLRIVVVVSLVCGLLTGGVAIAGKQKTVEGKVEIRHEAGMTWFYVVWPDHRMGVC
jgi:Na+-transporting NADH:ubiquinone oxidoreductase subunit NqrC